MPRDASISVPHSAGPAFFGVSRHFEYIASKYGIHRRPEIQSTRTRRSVAGHTADGRKGTGTMKLARDDLLKWPIYVAVYRGAKCCDEQVCLSVSRLAYLRDHTSKLRDIFCACYLWPWLGPPLSTLQHVMYFRFRG